MSEFTLDLLGPIILETRDRMARIEDRLTAIETTIDRHQDELTVTTAMVMRHASEPIAWSAMERQIKALAERLAKLEMRLPAAE